MQQIYRRTPMPKCGFNKVALQLYWNRSSAWVFTGKFALYFQNTFSFEHLWRAASEQWYRPPWKLYHRIGKSIGGKECYYQLFNDPVDTGRKLNVHKTFTRRPGRLLFVLCTFKLRPVSTEDAANSRISG